MKKFKSLFIVMGVCAAFGLVGCESDDTDTGTTPADTAIGTDAANSPDTTDAGTDAVIAGVDGDGGGTTDVKVEPDVPPAKTCDPACTGTQFCDLTVDPPKCKDATCALPSTFGPTIQKVSVVKLLATTEGCDLDDDGKPNNVVGKVVSLYKEVNTLLAEQIADGTVSIIFESKDWKTDGSSFAVSGLIGDVDASNADCNVIDATANCKYTINPSSYNKSAASGTCPALIGFSDAKVNGTAMTAGGDDATFALSIPITGIVLDLKISKAQISADVTDNTSWKSSKNGKICGVIAKTDLEAAINALPEEVLAQIGGKAQALTLINSLLAPDIDLDDDGKKDAISVGIGFESVPGQITGITPAK